MNLGQHILTAARRQGHLVIGVKVRDPQDRQTWELQFPPAATAAQRAAADAWKAQFDPVAAQDDEDRETFDEQRWLKALAMWTAQRMGVSMAQAREELLAIYRRL